MNKDVANVAPEIEITPEMIEAGKRAYFAWEKSDEPSAALLVRSILDQALAAGRKAGRSA